MAPPFTLRNLLACAPLALGCSVLFGPDRDLLDQPVDAGAESAVDVVDGGADTAPEDGPATDTEPSDSAPMDTVVADSAPTDTALDTAVADTVMADTVVLDSARDSTPVDTGRDAADVPGTRCPGGCNDGVPCTTDTCDEAAGRCVFRPNNGLCPEGQVCSATAGCTRVGCSSDAMCQNGDLCDGAERCTEGRCVAGTPVDCDDRIACTVERCEAATGMCIRTLNHGACDDRRFCNGAEVCDPSLGCRPGSAVACDDRVPCTVDTCNEGTRGCTHTPNPAGCPAPGPCVAGACSPVSGCVFTPVPGYCDSFCVMGARCDAATGMCTGGGTPRSCADTDPCTTDVCDPVMMACRNTPTDADRDGYPANRVGATVCPRGPDCDDMNPDVHPGAVERCNGLDDDCDGIVDNVAGCSRPGDTCDRAIPVNMAGRTMDTQTGSTAGFADDLRDACGGRGADVVYAFSVPASADVLFEAAGGSPTADPVLSVRTVCGSDPVVCNDDASAASGNTARVYLRPAGTTGMVTYYVTVDMTGEAGPFTLRTLLRNPGVRPAVCATPPSFDLSLGGAVYGVYAAGLSQHQSSMCRAGAVSTEDVLLLPGTTRRRVLVTLYDTNATVYVRQGACTGGSAMEVGCATNRTRAEFTVDLAAGPAWLFADSGANLSASRYVLVVYPQ